MTKKVVLSLLLLCLSREKSTLLFSKNSVELGEKAQEEKKQKEKQRLKRIGQVLTYGSSEQVRKALSSLSKLKPKVQKKFIPEMKEILNSSNILNQRKVLELIGNFKFNDLDNRVSPFLENKANEIFYTALRTVEKKKIKKALPLLHKTIKESDYARLDSRLPDILSVLGTLKDKTEAYFLFQKLKSESTIVEYKTGIVMYLASVNYQNEDSTQFLYSLLSNDDEDNRLRVAAAHSIGKMKLKGSHKILYEEFDKIERITDIDKKNRLRNLRIGLIYALVQVKNKKAEDILFSMARDDDEFMRLKALNYIKDIRSNRFKKLLDYQSQYDPSLRVQKKAKKILENFK